MNKRPLVSVIFISYKRIDLLKQTFTAFTNYCNYPNYETILCDDGSPKAMQEEMKTMGFDQLLLANKNQGMGRNVNKGIEAANGDYVLQIQDDFVLDDHSGDFLEYGVTALAKCTDVGMLRFAFTISLKNYYKINVENLTVKVFKRYQGGREKFIYSDWPHLKTKNFVDKVGFYKENKPMEKVEKDYALKFLHQNDLEIGTIPGFENAFYHIGVGDNSIRRGKLSTKIKMPFWRIAKKLNLK